MLKLLLLTAIIILVVSPPHNSHTLSRSQQDQLSHQAYFNRPCCLAQGGVECGHIWKSCCLGKCEDFMMIQHCTGRQISLPPELCSNSCVKQCRDKGGIICGTSFLKDSCCTVQNCNGALDWIRECRAGTQIPLSNCAPNTIV